MKTIILTGAAGNLGTVVTNTLLKQGYRIAAAVYDQQSLDSMPKHENLSAEIVDLESASQSAAFVKNCIAKYENVDGAFLLAGGFAMGGIEEVTLSDIHAQMKLNFETAFNIATPLFHHLSEKGSGKIVFVGSRPSLVAAAGKDMIAYGLSKSMLFKYAEYLNAAAKGKNVTATVIVPSTIDTPANRKSMPDADFNKWVKPEYIADTLVFLMSEAASVIREPVLKLYNNA